MKTVPMPIRLDQELQKLLRDGARRTPHRKQDLIRITLRLHLREVIEKEATALGGPRVTTIEPWPRRMVEDAYKRMGRDWDEVENIATRAQGRPGWND